MPARSEREAAVDARPPAASAGLLHTVSVALRTRQDAVVALVECPNRARGDEQKNN